MLKILLLFLYFICIQGELEFYPEISIKQGKLRGFHLTSRKGRYFNAFHRIPYAKAPVGDLRFKVIIIIVIVVVVEIINAVV
mgnify:CR=1 FL=1